MFPGDDDKWHEECGVFGVFECKEATKLCYLGLYALQHRGQESAGIVSFENGNFYVVKDEGLVSDVFNPENLSYLKGDTAIGHVRYSTTGSNNIHNIQPLYAETSKGKLAVAHNGNLTNAYSIYKKLRENGALFQSTVDTEAILHLISLSPEKTILGAIQNTLAQLEGAFSLLILGEGFLVAARDTYGFRPLVLGKLKDSYVIASETCAFDLIGAEYIREIEPGEIVMIDKENGLTSHRIPKTTRKALCIFEHIYFARPDSHIFGDDVHMVRKAFGRVLAEEFPIDADLVMSIPDSGNSAALGYAQASGIPYEIGMTRNHYIGRTFIQPQQKIRDLDVRIKLNPIKSVLNGKRVIVIDDSLVRGTTSKQRITAIRKAGAKEVHLLISSPPITNPCHFGIDTPKREKLIASQKTLEEIRKHIGADTLGYLSLKGMLNAIKSQAPEDFCSGCFTGKYPLSIKNKGKFSFESKKIKLYAQKN
ncbi:MAG: amidophosphoribosyltransferase [Candidatus Margulisbacteria bacterium]|nr:amidophosphoribosyltransferase [Candidatus Margulisiibacteriota bacterium]